MRPSEIGAPRRAARRWLRLALIGLVVWLTLSGLAAFLLFDRLVEGATQATRAQACKHFAFSPPFPESDLPNVHDARVRRRVCAADRAGSLAVEKVWIDRTTGSGLGGRNEQTVQLWLLEQTGSVDGVWRRVRLLESDVDSFPVWADIARAKFDLGAAEGRVAVVARRANTTVWYWLVERDGSVADRHAEFDGDGPPGSAVELLRRVTAR